MDYTGRMMLARVLDELAYLVNQSDTTIADKRSIRRALLFLEAVGRRNGLQPPKRD